MPPRRPRLLVLVIAYNAEPTLRRVLERIAPSVLRDNDCHVLIVDDASADRTYEVGREYRDAHPDFPLTVLRNRTNQGYGGNQKVGYAFAIAEGFDYVAMIHGDGQYAPEELPRLLEPLRAGEADAVFGSRMMTPGGARRGGMPLYKLVGNRILSAFQNAVLGTRLSEFHSGYRIYAVDALRRIPFRLNSDDFHFDTEIIIQLLHARMRIVELPIPTYYGDEISYVNGLAYAKNVVAATLKSAAHRAGIFYQRRYDPEPAEGNRHYEIKLGYASSHTWALDAVPAGQPVIDIGAGPGGLAAELVRKGCPTAVVDRSPPEAAPPGVQVLQQDLDQPLAFAVAPYRYMLLLDVIEHLRDPERFLEQLRRQFDHEPRTLVLTTPNVAFVVQRLMLLAGQWNYGKAGILDRTHTRLFTFRTLRQLMEDAGFRIKEVRGVPAPFPKVLGDGLLGRAAVAANLALITLSKTLFSYQIFVVAETTPDLSFVLKDTRGSGAQAPTAVQSAPIAKK